MGLCYENLDEEVRSFMVEEIEMDIASEKIYLSRRLTQRSQGDWAGMLLQAARVGNDVFLENLLIRNGCLNTNETRILANGRTTQVRIPNNAAEILAESEFNRYYCRGLSRKAVQNQIPRLEVYRAKITANPRPESDEKVGLLVDPEVILTDLRSSTGVEPALGIPPGPGSGLTIRIPR